MPTQRPKNQERAKKVEALLLAYGAKMGSKHEDVHTTLSDLLADLRHLADFYDLSWHQLMNTCDMHYHGEVDGDDFDPDL